MKIGSYTYKGFKYDIMFTDKGDWGEFKHHFYTECDHNFSGGFALKFEEVDNKIKAKIDAFVSTSPKTIDELVSQISNQLIWTGYEDCHLDLVTTKALIEAFSSRP